VAVAVAGIWYVVDPSRAFWITVSVLVVSCPCALSLATPAALTAALGRLTRLGLLSTRGHALETLAHATDFVFDKTGTLTTGEFKLLDMEVLRGDRSTGPWPSPAPWSRAPPTRWRRRCAMRNRRARWTPSS
jgi:Cu2+-exporting ATPase